MKEYYLKQADYDDIDLLFNWANDKGVRNNSFSVEPISYDEHEKWFKEKINSEDSIIFIYYYENVPTGQIRVDITCDEAIVNYSVDERYRFLGHGKIILSLLEITLKSDYPKIKYLRARVKHTNVASQVKFEQSDYKKSSETNEYIEYYKGAEAFTNQLPERTYARGRDVIFLANNGNSLPLYNWLNQQENHTILFSEKLNALHFANYKPDFIISYNYKYLIDESVLELIDNGIINLHISLLPWNRGSDPNFWSFIENTPKGVTIHKVDKGIDSGDIIVQEECFFDEDTETLKSTYEFLHQKIQTLFMKNWQQIKNGDIITHKQNLIGSKHTRKDFVELTKSMPLDWNESIRNLKDRISLNDKLFENGIKTT